jgi:hypothetical protein
MGILDMFTTPENTKQANMLNAVTSEKSTKFKIAAGHCCFKQIKKLKNITNIKIKLLKKLLIGKKPKFSKRNSNEENVNKPKLTKM